MLMSNNENNEEIRFCKKCGCELSSTNKRKLCDNCRRERDGRIRNGAIGAGGTVGSIVLFVITKGGHGGGNKACFVSICPKKDIWHPVRGSFHLFADGFQVNSGIALNDQFIMDVSSDEAMPEGLHSIAEDIAADGLNDIFHEFRTVGFDAFSFLCRAHAFICDGFSAELIGINSGFHICNIWFSTMKTYRCLPLIP